MKKILIALLLAIVCIPFVDAVIWIDTIKPDSADSDYCSGGVCDGDLNIPGDLNFTGNLSGSLIYGEMYNYSSHANPWTFDITADDVYFNMTGFVEGNCNGFSFTDANQTYGGSYLTNHVEGVYKVCFSISFSSNNVGGTFGLAVVQNWDVTANRDCYARREASTDIGNAGVCCLLDLVEDDAVSVQVENEDNTRDMIIHTMNMNLVKVGS